MTYRGAPLQTAESALNGTAAHGVLGRRWIYDGATDPVLLEQLTELLCGRVGPQHQSRSDQIDELVAVRTAAAVEPAAKARVVRVLAAGCDEALASVSATWTAPNGAAVTGAVVTA